MDTTTQIGETEDSRDIATVELPEYFLKCSRSDLIVLISRMLVFLIQINDRAIKSEEQVAGNTERKLTRFHSSTPPNISIYNYLIRLTKYSALESAVLLTSVYYIDLLSSIYPSFTLNSLTAHRFLLTATSIASKGLCDSFCTNAHYAKVGGVQCSELNILEEEFLRNVNYRVIPRDDNITWCKFEHQQEQLTIPESNIVPQGLKPYNMHVNSGFNVLDMYYRKMIQLIGDYSSSPDKSRKVNYKLQPLAESKKNSVNNLLNDGSLPNIYPKFTNKRTFEASNSHDDNHDDPQISTADKTTEPDLDSNQYKKHTTKGIKSQQLEDDV